MQVFFSETLHNLTDPKLIIVVCLSIACMFFLFFFVFENWACSFEGSYCSVLKEAAAYRKQVTVCWYGGHFTQTKEPREKRQKERERGAPQQAGLCSSFHIHR